MGNQLLEYTNAQVRNKKLWETIEKHEAFDTKTNPLQARVVSWIALQSTTNQPAAKSEIQKYLDGTTTLQKLMDGLSKSIASKYNITLNFNRITELEHQDLMHAPSPELRIVYIAVKTILTKDHDRTPVLEFLNVLFPDTAYTDQDITESIYEPFTPTAFTVQQRFDEMITDDAFRIYFKSADQSLPILTIPITSEQELKSMIQNKFLANLIATGKTNVVLQNSYKLEK